MNDRERLRDQLDRVDRAREARKKRPTVKDERVTLSHGSGGKATHDLVDGLFVPAFANAVLDRLEDSAVMALDGTGARCAFTTDSYVVSPIFFPGGDIGRLAVNGTINDLAVAGARPLAISAGMILEEGLPMEVLRRVVESMRDAAQAAGVSVVTGDTKVVPRGKCDQLFVNTAGVGVVDPSRELSMSHARPGDRVLLSGSIADHGMAVMIAREALEIETDIVSDTAPVHRRTAAVLEAAAGTRCFKDPTRGGVATALNEIAGASQVGIVIDEATVPVGRAVQGACEILGIDPLHVANEGRLLVVVAPDDVDAALGALHESEGGAGARCVGEVVEEPEGMVVLRTSVGGTRVVDMLVGDPLPRIC